jgi:outer membrane protein
MKKLLGVFSILFLLASCNQTKIAYVDVSEILKEYKGSKKAEEEMRIQSDKIGKELDALALPFQQKVQEYQQNSKNLSDSERKLKEQELMQEQQIIQRQQQMAQQQVQEEGQKKVEIINDEIESFLAEYAQSNGFTYILGTSSQTRNVMYGDETLNITEAIIEALNKEYSSDNEENNPDNSAKDSID